MRLDGEKVLEAVIKGKINATKQLNIVTGKQIGRAHV